MGHHGNEPEDQHAGYGWLAVCVIGMVSSLTMYGIVLEYVTSGGRKLHELSFVFVTTSIYAITAFIAREMGGEKRTEISKYKMLTLSLTSISSTFTSVRSLRYVIYPVQVLFKSCKPVPVMLFGIYLGKKYPLQKYVNVGIITTGVALFMGGGASSSKSRDNSDGGMDTLILGGLMLSISLCFDGLTGAYEDKMMAEDNVQPFDLMYNIQLGKAVISFVCLVVTNGLNEFIHTLQLGGLPLVLLGLTGAVGQVFVFLTINKFGALNCALIGLVRKILSLLLSFFLYGHSLNAFQTVGLVLSIGAMCANFMEKKPGHGHRHGKANKKDAAEAPPQENVPLLEESDDEESKAGLEMKNIEDDHPPQESLSESTEKNLIDFEQPPSIVNPSDRYNQLPASRDDSV